VILIDQLKEVFIDGVARGAADPQLERRLGEATELSFDETGESDRGLVVEIAADDLHTDRQAALGAAVRRDGRRQTVQRGDPGPDALIVIGHLLLVDVDAALVVRLGVIVRARSGNLGLSRVTGHPSLPRLSASLFNALLMLLAVGQSGLVSMTRTRKSASLLCRGGGRANL
jgi:hypothetical protein